MNDSIPGRILMVGIDGHRRGVFVNLFSENQIGRIKWGNTFPVGGLGLFWVLKLRHFNGYKEGLPFAQHKGLLPWDVAVHGAILGDGNLDLGAVLGIVDFDGTGLGPGRVAEVVVEEVEALRFQRRPHC